MSWSRPKDLRTQIQRLWDRGEILAAMVTGEPLFPRRLSLKGPSSAEIGGRFDEVRAWIAELRGLPWCRVELREFRHRLYGLNSIPQEVWVDEPGKALTLIGKGREASQFGDMIEATHGRQPGLLPWLARRPLRALALHEDWERLLAIVTWIESHPHPGLYLRQVDVPGVHSKFIESHRGLLAELLDQVLPPEAIDSRASGVSQFARRYGFRDKPSRIRFRLLDPRLRFLSGGDDQEISLDAGSFARLDPGVSRVFITENEVNFLALPEVPGSLAIFGAGYGFEMLAEARWLSACRVHYWGDIDTHGFAILDQLRACLPQAESLLMDRATLLAFESQWGAEERQTLRDLSRLTQAEQDLYDDLRDNLIRRNLRLEQERIGFGWVAAALSELR